MTVTKLTGFQRAYLKLKNNDDMKFNIEFYHNDDQSEPFLSIFSYVERVFVYFAEDHGSILNIFTSETMIGFSEKNFRSTVSDDSVLFISNHDDDTYCVVSFA